MQLPKNLKIYVAIVLLIVIVGANSTPAATKTSITKPSPDVLPRGFLNECKKIKPLNLKLPLDVQVVDKATEQLGKPYVWGASGPDSFDCSGLVLFCYRSIGVSIGRVSYDQARCGTPVPLDQLKVGDIIGMRGWEHVGLYVGNGMYIHVPHSGDVVKVAPLSSCSSLSGAVRIIQ